MNDKIVGLILRAGYVESEKYTGLCLSHTKGGFSTPTAAFTNFLETVRDVCGCTNNTQLLNCLMEIYDGDNDSVDYYDTLVPIQEAGWDIGVIPIEGRVAEIMSFNYLGRNFNNHFENSSINEDKFDCAIFEIKRVKSFGSILIPFIKFEKESDEDKRNKLMSRLSAEDKRLLGITNE